MLIEILSKDDRVSEQERIDNDLNFGVRHVWVINPNTHRAREYTKKSSHEAKTVSCAQGIRQWSYRFPKFSRLCNSFSTCLASTSHSRFRRSPGVCVPSVVI